MREILFRAKRIVDGKWIEGYYYKRVQEKNVVDAIEVFNGNINSIEYYEIYPETLCQLVNTNKIRVWENDIIRWEDEDIVSVIKYDEESAKFIIEDYGVKGCLMEYGWDEDAGDFGKIDIAEFDDFSSFNGFKVIGNVFDNPELIKR